MYICLLSVCLVLCIAQCRALPYLTRQNSERIGYYSRNDIAENFHSQRQKRAAKIIGHSVLVGLRAAHSLLKEAARVPSRGSPKQFIKPGGFEKGVDDFLSVKPNAVHAFEMPPGTYISIGHIGDRQLILKQGGVNQNPILQIMQWKRIGVQPRDNYRITDEITYVD